jgi:sortase A
MTVRLILQNNTLGTTGWRLAQGFFLVTGLLALGYATYYVAVRYACQTYESREFDASVALRQAGPLLVAESVASQSLVGKIEIPRLNISAMVKEGIDDRTLDLAAGHIPNTALPGQKGNVGVASRRDSLFRNLKDVRQDDRITLTTLDHEYVYRVTSLKIVLPTDVSVLEPSPEGNTLTLVTCYPFYLVGQAPKRFIVHAVQVL